MSSVPAPLSHGANYSPCQAHIPAGRLGLKPPLPGSGRAGRSGGYRRRTLLAPSSKRRRHQARQADEPHHVGEDLQAVHQVAPGPDRLGFAHGAKIDEAAVHPAVGPGDLRAHDVLEELLAVIRPADEGGVAEQEGAEGHHPAAHQGHRRVEGRGHQRRARGPRAPHATHQHGERADGRRHERDDEDLHHRVEPLLDGPLAAGAAVGHRRGAIAGLVGVDAPGQAVAHGRHHRHARRAATGCLHREGLAEDEGKHRGQLTCVEEDDPQPAQQVQADLQGGQLLGHAANAADAPDDDEPGQHGDAHARDFTGNVELALHHHGHGVGLCEGGGGQGRDARHQRIEPGQGGGAQAVPEVVHGARRDVALLHRAVADAQHRLGELDDGGEEAVAPDPEHRARSPRDDGGGHARDVARADGGRQGGHEGLEGRQRAAGPFLLGGNQRASGFREASHLDEAVAQGEEEPRAEEERQGPGPPDEVTGPQDGEANGLGEHVGANLAPRVWNTRAHSRGTQTPDRKRG
ncbi:conserved hypothetical protein [Stigmatella aurantiaca DW4/3-1]|uniref:Uncharacterized protein n=1 Tax=Stigmatella aurantiaca (strain DW4/3-1) TaxID=378806 RepID=Q099W8_STIAD|nr:conserved hypothetical protein [Stigmatella aurantiaca DW4/3-1]